MTTLPDTDTVLESLLDELRAVMAALNDAHHPVYLATPARLAELERRADELRAQVAARRREIAALA